VVGVLPEEAATQCAADEGVWRAAEEWAGALGVCSCGACRVCRCHVWVAVCVCGCRCGCAWCVLHTTNVLCASVSGGWDWGRELRVRWRSLQSLSMHNYMPTTALVLLPEP
jgi:hypothetical protein